MHADFRSAVMPDLYKIHEFALAATEECQLVMRHGRQHMILGLPSSDDWQWFHTPRPDALDLGQRMLELFEQSMARTIVAGTSAGPVGIVSGMGRATHRREAVPARSVLIQSKQETLADRRLPAIIAPERPVSLFHMLRVERAVAGR
ncbi:MULTISPECIES: hypothetical protein [unclassified Bradyrhizobium]|uniref:hypothetical protein n=1 Tax=unclassified Bradyrhizobium TaxID=2631580 RepID=UPI0028EE21F4|nr:MULTISPECIES: hypothetical protein [unclassified Bradyrhizobium]